ncbi:MAG TPA: hypothetical protein PKM44_03350, partial [Turneriella sp.]|nr:hypothetical protein [Turneriella sp.]
APYAPEGPAASPEGAAAERHFRSAQQSVKQKVFSRSKDLLFSDTLLNHNCVFVAASTLVAYHTY